MAFLIIIGRLTTVASTVVRDAKEIISMAWILLCTIERRLGSARIED